MVVCRLVRFGQIPSLSSYLAMVCSDVNKKKVKRAINFKIMPLYSGCDVIGLIHNRRSQGGDVLVPAGFAIHASLAASMSARGFLCMRILLPHPTYTHIPCDAFSLWVGWRGRGVACRTCVMHASGRVRGCSTRRFGPFTHGDGLGDGGGFLRHVGGHMGGTSRAFVNVSMYCAMGEWLERG
jgi:hypothetical protein